MEKKQVLYIIISVGLALTLFIVGAIWIISSKKQGTSSLAALQSGTSNTTAPTAQAGDSTASAQGQGASSNTVNPTEWVKNPQTVQGIQTPPPGTPTTRGDIIIVYGDNTVTSKTSGALPPAAVDPNSVVIQVPQPQTSDTAPVGTSTVTSTVTNQTVETKPATGTGSGSAASVQINQTKTVTSAPAKSSAGTTAAQTAAKPSTPKTYTDYWVQTGAYSTKLRAENAKEQLKAKGISSVVDVKDVNGKTYYRVRIGPYTTQKEAQYWLSLVKNIDGFAESYVSSVQTKR
ncbi:SPOR domain-containing protein [Gracilinema caldarium]|uniref:SPOR domain-containing protein n=1 Tax=Gracilinema caldarium TaxID=215591 RepID=UPI0026E958DC|nr:SPOR domain-containing protein [Gracilinema caldarium]